MKSKLNLSSEVEQHFLHRLQHYDCDLLLREEEFVREKVASKPFQVWICFSECMVPFPGSRRGYFFSSQ